GGGSRGSRRANPILPAWTLRTRVAAGVRRVARRAAPRCGWSCPLEDATTRRRTASTVRQRLVFPRRALRGRHDGMEVVVAGGGVIGLLSALRLSQDGHHVTVLEPSEPGSEASWAAAGILGAQSEADGPGPMLDLCRRSLALYPALADELGDIGYSRCGALHVAFTEAEAADLRRQLTWQSAAGLRAELRGAAGAALALWQPDDAV